MRARGLGILFIFKKKWKNKIAKIEVSDAEGKQIKGWKSVQNK